MSSPTATFTVIVNVYSFHFHAMTVLVLDGIELIFVNLVKFS